MLQTFAELCLPELCGVSYGNSMNILILGKVFTCRLYDKDQVVDCMMSLILSQINDTS